MYEALKELMKDEIDKTVNEAVDKTAINMLKNNEPISKITKYTELSSEAVIKLAESIGVSVVY